MPDEQSVVASEQLASVTGIAATPLNGSTGLANGNLSAAIGNGVVGASVSNGAARDSARRGFRASLFSSAYFDIAIATAVTVIVYILPRWDGKTTANDSYVAIGAGIAAGIGVGLIYSLLQRGHTAPDHMNPRQFGELS